MTTGQTAGKLIFVTGASRSGTTLLSFVLRNHSEVFGLKELHYFGEWWDPRTADHRISEAGSVSALASVFARQARGILLAKPDAQDFARARQLLDAMPAERRSPADLFQAAVGRMSADAGKAIPCEQTPRNIFYAESLLRLYPEARIVHMLRDPRAVMASQKRRWRRRSLAADKTALPFGNAVREWVNYHPYTATRLWSRATCEARRLSGHPRFTLVRFEDLLESPEETVRYLCDRLDLGFENAMLDIGQVNSSHQSTAGGTRKGFFKEAAQTWKKTLSTTEIAIADRLCAELMKQFGYLPEPRRLSNVAGELRYLLTYPFHVAGVFAVNPRRAWVQLQAALTVPRPGKFPGVDTSASAVRRN